MKALFFCIESGKVRFEVLLTMCIKLVGCDTVLFGRQIPMFGMNVGPRFLGLMLLQTSKTLVCVY